MNEEYGECAPNGEREAPLVEHILGRPEELHGDPLWLLDGLIDPTNRYERPPDTAKASLRINHAIAAYSYQLSHAKGLTEFAHPVYDLELRRDTWDQFYAAYEGQRMVLQLNNPPSGRLTVSPENRRGHLSRSRLPCAISL